MQYNLADDDEILNAKHKLAWYIAAGKTIDMTESTNQRTGKQNNALYKFFELLADELNQAGYDMRRTLKADADIPWTPDNVKRFLWHPIMKAQLNKTSTTELTTTDIDKVYDTLNRHLGSKFGVSVEFPSQVTRTTTE